MVRDEDTMQNNMRRQQQQQHALAIAAKIAMTTRAPSSTTMEAHIRVNVRRTCDGPARYASVSKPACAIPDCFTAGAFGAPWD